MRPSEPVDPRLPWIRTLYDLEPARATTVPAERIDALRRAGRALGDALRKGPRVLGVKTLDNAVLPYPTRFAFQGSVPLPWPFVLMTHRTLLVRLQTEAGIKNLLFNPTDAEAAKNAPFFAGLARAAGKMYPFVDKLLSRRFEPLEVQLRAAGVAPEEVDVIAYDHFHTQDLRPVIGVGEASGRFPKALLLAPAREWRDWDGLHPMQRPWMIADGKAGVAPERVVAFDADLALGQGCLLLRTPGHTSGNQTLFVHGAEGVFGCSENGCSADNWSPRHSAIVGLSAYARQYGYEVVLNANTPELGGEQYGSMILERAVVDAVPGRPEFAQMFPSSEVTPSPIAPLVRPSVIFRRRDSGLYAA